MAASLDGNLYGLDANDGTVVLEKYFASPLGTSAIISASATGEQFLFVNVGGVPPRFAESVSGLVFAYKLRPDTTTQPGGQTNKPSEPQQSVSPGGISFDLIIPIVVAIVVVLFIASLLRKNKSKPKPTST